MKTNVCVGTARSCALEIKPVFHVFVVQFFLLSPCGMKNKHAIATMLIEFEESLIQCALLIHFGLRKACEPLTKHV